MTPVEPRETAPHPGPTPPYARRRNAELVPTGLLSRCQSGEQAAIAALFDLILDDVHRILFRIVGADPEHEDLCQEALLAVLGSLPRFRHESAFSTWVYAVCANVAAQELRRRQRRKLSAPAVNPDGLATRDLPDAAMTPEEALLARERAAVGRHALERMKPKKRLVYALCDIEGLAATEVAEVVGTSVATVHTRLFHARRELHRALERHGLPLEGADD